MAPGTQPQKVCLAAIDVFLSNYRIGRLFGRIYFVRSGRVNPSGPALNYTGIYGYYWSSTPTSTGVYAYLLAFTKTGVVPSDGSNRSDGFPLRCLAR